MEGGGGGRGWRGGGGGGWRVEVGGGEGGQGASSLPASKP